MTLDFVIVYMCNSMIYLKSRMLNLQLTLQVSTIILQYGREWQEREMGRDKGENKTGNPCIYKKKCIMKNKII